MQQKLPMMTPARTPKNIASSAIAAMSNPTRATCPMSPTDMPLSMIDAVR